MISVISILISFDYFCPKIRVLDFFLLADRGKRSFTVTKELFFSFNAFGDKEGCLYVFHLLAIIYPLLLSSLLAKVS